MNVFEPQPQFLRLKQVLKIIPLGRSCWLKGVKEGRYPQPVRLSAKCVAWRVKDIEAFIVSLTPEPQEKTSNCIPKGGSHASI